MKVAGIVCEYNPFHNGHKYHIDETKRSGADAVVCVMSSGVCQRGEFSFFDKFTRAKAAVLCGADLVLELPAVYAMSPAPDFSKGAISILDSLGVVNTLSFGSESADMEEVEEMLFLFSEENDKVKEELKKGVSFPKALSSLGKEALPNDILAIEYLKAIKALDSDISPMPVLRKAVSHDGCGTSDGFMSAKSIRELSKSESFEKAKGFIPEKAYEIFSEKVEDGKIIDEEKVSLSVLAYLRRLTLDEIRRAPEISEGIENRIFSAIKDSHSLEELLSKIKTKRYTMAKIKRIIMSLYLGIKKGESAIAPPYIRVLASNSKGNEILKQAKKKAKLPVVHSLLRASEISEDAKRIADIEARVSDLRSIALIAPDSSGKDYTTKNIVLTEKDFSE